MQRLAIGLDLGVTSKSEIALASKDGIEYARQVATTPEGLIEAIRQAGKDREVSIVVESTAMSWFLAAVAAKRSGVDCDFYRVSGRKASALRKFYATYTKTDRIDAKILARMPGVDDSLRSFDLPESSELALKRLVNLRWKLNQQSSVIKSRLRSTLHWAVPGLTQVVRSEVSTGMIKVLRRWPDLRKLARARPETVAKLTRWKLDRAEKVVRITSDAIRFYEGQVDFEDLALEFEVALGQLSALEAQTDRLEARIGELYRTRYPEDQLTTIPGIGDVIAAVIRAQLDDMSRFTSLAGLKAFTGLVPKENSSGEMRKRGNISKAGPPMLRWALYLAANTARQWDPQLADLYRRLMVERSKTHAQALCAVASHLVGRIWAVVRENRPYRWRDLEGNLITRQQARLIARSMRVDQQTRERLRATRKREPATPRSRQPEAPQGVDRLSSQQINDEPMESTAGAPM